MGFFGDSFDAYAAIADAGAGWWDSAANGSFVSGRFSGSRAVALNSSTVVWSKSSASNDAVHHIVCSVFYNAISGSTLGLAFTLSDGATAQCSVVFRSDGAVLLTSGGATGTTLATWSGAVPSATVWYGFEFEVKVDGSAGYLKGRRNGRNDGSNDYDSATNLNTKVSSNAYASKFTLGMGSSANIHYVDDLLWQYGATPGTWLGDIRATWQAPASDSSRQFTPGPTQTQTVAGSGSTAATANGTARYSPFTAAFTGTIGTAVINANANATANVKCAIYDATGTAGAPGAVVGSVSNVLVNPVSGANTVTFGTPVPVVKGTAYYLVVDQDASVTWKGTGSTGYTSSQTYASFPGSTGALTGSAMPVNSTVTITPTDCWQMVSEAIEDGDTTYVADSTVGHTDIYNLGALTTTPLVIIGTQARMFSKKTDTGARTGGLVEQSGTVSNTTTLAQSTTYTWIKAPFRDTDPATGVAWTATGVNANKLGPTVVS